jgi:hypothetical protein
MITARSKRLAEFVTQGENALRYIKPQAEQVVRMVAEGRTYKQIGLQLGLTQHQVRGLAAKAERKLNEKKYVVQKPKDRTFILLRIYNEDGWGSEAKCKIEWQGTKEQFLELHPIAPESPGMQLWLELGTRGTTLFFEERYDCAPGNYEQCGDPRFT